MSLASQFDEIDRLVTADNEVTVVDRYEEAYSAKQPGRPLFDQMLARIEKGEAEGIISWHPDRLARNSMDGGRIIYLLDQGKLKDMKFCSYSFENSSQGKFMLNIIFGYSKYYVDALSENVKRGLRTKLRNGWQPNLAPIGYRNCKESGTIVVDETHFRAIKNMFGLLLTGQYTVPAIHRIVWEDWGYTTPILKTRGGTRLGRSSLYRIFGNPFYAGYIRWNGQLYKGNQQQMLSKSDFEKAQKLLGNAASPRPKNKTFAFGGVFTCGACGLSVTAERKRKKSGLEYIYYHCTRVHRNPKCTQPSIEEKDLAQQITIFLDGIVLPKSLLRWFARELSASKDQLVSVQAQIVQKLADQVASLKTQLSNLTDLRVREMLTDTEFTGKRERLQRALGEAEENAAKTKHQPVTFEPLQILQILSTRAKYWFDIADEHTKQKVLKILCSNPVIIDKKALLVAKKPFVDLGHLFNCLNLRGDADDVRNDHNACANSTITLKKLRNLASEPELMELAKEVRILIEQIDPTALVDLQDRQ